MPKVLNYTPPWLCRPSKGFDLFQPSSAAKLVGANPAAQDEEPLRTLARRGTEIFVAVGNELRWSDLLFLNEDWKNEHDTDGAISRDDLGGYERPHRILKVPVSRKIKRLLVSPGGDYLAIVTSHTVHVALLPDSSLLNAQDSSPLRLRAFQLGPTTHVLERAPIASVLWHPLGLARCCLVTITTDAIVRLWELDRENRWSFDSAALGIDLKLLANGQSNGENFTPSKYGSNRVFSPDSFEMEVASACFGGIGTLEEEGWAPMTLWVGMREGDIYAISPLLPSKFQLPESTLASLSLQISGHDSGTLNRSNKTQRQQKLWVQDLQNQQRLFAQQRSDKVNLFTRPAHPGPIPKLQGPLQYAPDVDQMFDITDIFAISAGAVRSASLSTQLEIEDEQKTLPLNLVCIATSDGKIHVCVDSDGIEASWQPSKNSSAPSEDEVRERHELLVIESLVLEDESCFPVFTPDSLSRYAFFVTSNRGVSYVSAEPWAQKLAEEIDGEVDSGAEFRLQIALDNAKTKVEQPIRLSNPPREAGSASTAMTACINLLDSDLGYFVLVSANNQPQASTLDYDPYGSYDDDAVGEEDEDLDDRRAESPEARPGYQPPTELWAKSSLPSFIEQRVHTRHARSMKDEVRLSPLVFNLMMDAHRILSQETHRLGLAAADLFSRCERMQDEFRDQLGRVDEAANRIDSVLDDNADTYEDDEVFGASDDIERRLHEASARQESLAARHADLRRKLSRAHGAALTKKEKAWASEIDRFAQLIGTAEEGPATLQEQRLEELKKFTEELLAQSKKQAETASETSSETSAPSALVPSSPEKSSRPPGDIKKLLDQQRAHVDALVERISRLGELSL